MRRPRSVSLWRSMALRSRVETDGRIAGWPRTHAGHKTRSPVNNQGRFGTELPGFSRSIFKKNLRDASLPSRSKRPNKFCHRVATFSLLVLLLIGASGCQTSTPPPIVFYADALSTSELTLFDHFRARQHLDRTHLVEDIRGLLPCNLPAHPPVRVSRRELTRLLGEPDRIQRDPDGSIGLIYGLNFEQRGPGGEVKTLAVKVKKERCDCVEQTIIF